MEPVAILNPHSITFAPQPYAVEFDSDIEAPQLSEAFTETDNDTPPETPSRPTMTLDSPDELQSCGIKEGCVEIPNNLGSSDSDMLHGSPIIPPPAHVSEPLVVATPHPIRPAVRSFRLFGAELDEEDAGYHSDHEFGPQPTNRPKLPRIRSNHLAPHSDQGRSGPVTPKLAHGLYSFLKQPREHGPSPLSTPIQASRPRASPFLGRPSHPPPVADAIHNLTRNIGDSLIGGHRPTTGCDPIEEMEPSPDLGVLPNETVLSTCVRNDRSNEIPGLEDTWVTQTIAPMQTSG